MNDFEAIIKNYFVNKNKEVTCIKKYQFHFHPVNEIYLVVANEKGYIVVENAGYVDIISKTSKEDSWTLDLFDSLFESAEKYEDLKNS